MTDANNDLKMEFGYRSPFVLAVVGQNGISETPRRRVQEQCLSFVGVRLRYAQLLGLALLVIVQNGVNHAQART